MDNSMSDPRTVCHIDMNAFFASVEQQANPALRGKPIAVVGGGGRTVITTSSYEARAKGVKTGMAIWEAKRCCPVTPDCKPLLLLFFIFIPVVGLNDTLFSVVQYSIYDRVWTS